MPYCIELVSIGSENQGIIHVVMKINNKTMVHPVETPRVKKTEVKMAKNSNEIGSPIDGTVWRIGNAKRGVVRIGDIIHKGEEICNLEAMKMENAVFAPFDAKISEIPVKLNDTVKEGQLLFALEKMN